MIANSTRLVAALIAVLAFSSCRKEAIRAEDISELRVSSSLAGERTSPTVVLNEEASLKVAAELFNELRDLDCETRAATQGYDGFGVQADLKDGRTFRATLDPSGEILQYNDTNFCKISESFSKRFKELVG